MPNNQQSVSQDHQENISHEAIQKRREALKKLGKFSMYATPVLVGAVNQAHAVGLSEA